MGKLQKNESGFSIVEVVLVILVVALIGTVAWLVYKNHHKNTTAAITTTSATKPVTTTKPAAPTSSTNLTSYTDSSKTYTLLYPSDWTVTEQSNSGADTTETLLGATSPQFTPSNLPSSAIGNTAVDVSAYTGSLSTIFQNVAYGAVTGDPVSEAYNPQSLTINGYPALYNQLVAPLVSSAGYSFTADYYGVYHNGVTVVFLFREKQTAGQTNVTPKSFDVTNDNSAYTAMVKSIKFLN